MPPTIQTVLQKNIKLKKVKVCVNGEIIVKERLYIDK